MRILVIRWGALGDLLHLSPSLAAVQALYPQAEIHLLTSPMYQPLAALLPGVHSVWTWDKKTGWAGLFKVAAELRHMKFDGVVNLHPSFKSLLLTQLLRNGFRLVRQAVYRKQKFRVKGQAQRSLPRRHAVDDFYQPFRQLLNLPQGEHLIPRLPLPETVQVALPPKPPGQRWVGLIPGVGAKRSNRAWEPEGYVQLIVALLQRQNLGEGVQVFLIGGPDEKPLAEEILAALPKRSDFEGSDCVQNHCGAHDIVGTAALLSQCDVVVGGDTGPLHLAAAVGAPIVAIYGPTALARTGPVVVQPIQALTPPEGLACWPCELPQCPYSGPEHLACMRQIPVEVVLTQVLAQLGLA